MKKFLQNWQTFLANKWNEYVTKKLVISIYKYSCWCGVHTFNNPRWVPGYNCYYGKCQFCNAKLTEDFTRLAEDPLKPRLYTARCRVTRETNSTVIEDAISRSIKGIYA